MGVVLTEGPSTGSLDPESSSGSAAVRTALFRGKRLGCDFSFERSEQTIFQRRPLGKEGASIGVGGGPKFGLPSGGEPTRLVQCL